MSEVVDHLSAVQLQLAGVLHCCVPLCYSVQAGLFRVSKGHRGLRVQHQRVHLHPPGQRLGFQAGLPTSSGMWVLVRPNGQDGVRSSRRMSSGSNLNASRVYVLLTSINNNMILVAFCVALLLLTSHHLFPPGRQMFFLAFSLWLQLHVRS